MADGLMTFASGGWEADREEAFLRPGGGGGLQTSFFFWQNCVAIVSAKSIGFAQTVVFFRLTYLTRRPVTGYGAI